MHSLKECARRKVPIAFLKGTNKNELGTKYSILGTSTIVKETCILDFWVLDVEKCVLNI